MANTTYSPEETPSGTLDAATPANVDLHLGNGSESLVVVKNTGGTNPINSVKVFIRASSEWVEVTVWTAAFGSIAAGAVGWIAIEGYAGKGLRLTLESTSGTTYSVEARGY